MMSERIALIGGVYNNYLALEAAARDALRRGVDAIYCLGDLGAFGPHPDRVFPVLADYNIEVVQGNYDHSIGNGLSDCQCGYTDPLDNYFGLLSYRYSFENTSDTNKNYLKNLPENIRFELGDHRILLCHGSPKKMNEFLWQSTTSIQYLEKLCMDNKADIICGTHTGLHYHQSLSNNRHFINVGVVGRPANDGKTNVWYTVLAIDKQHSATVDFVPVEYDHRRLAAEMKEESIIPEFIETILTGWWTTCLEVLPSKERKRGKF